MALPELSALKQNRISGSQQEAAHKISNINSQFLRGVSILQGGKSIFSSLSISIPPLDSL
jgi:hypothetical protein